MNKLTCMRNLIPYSHKVTIYVPGTIGISKAADTKPWVSKAAELMTGLFGGATATAALGYWQSKKEGLVQENTTMVFAYAETLNDDNMTAVLMFCNDLKQALAQEAISLEVDNVLYLV